MNSADQPVRGKVARVLNTREVAINKGADDGVEIGMIFKILSPKVSEIEDPDTGELLGSVDLVKTRVKVTIVQERIAVASTYRSHRVNVGGNRLSLTNSLFEPPKWETRLETLRIDKSSIVELEGSDAIVHTGDSVVQDLEIVPADTEAPN